MLLVAARTDLPDADNGVEDQDDQDDQRLHVRRESALVVALLKVSKHLGNGGRNERSAVSSLSIPAPTNKRDDGRCEENLHKHVVKLLQDERQERLACKKKKKKKQKVQ